MYSMYFINLMIKYNYFVVKTPVKRNCKITANVSIHINKITVILRALI